MYISPNWHFASYSTWMRLGCLSATEAGIFPCGAVQILATRSIYPSIRPARDFRTPGLPIRPPSSLEVIVSAIRVVFVGFVFPPFIPPFSFFFFLPFCVLFFLALYAFCCARPGAFCFTLDSMDFYVTAFWFRLRLSHRLVSLFSADFMALHCFSSGKDHTQKNWLKSIFSYIKIFSKESSPNYI